MRSLCLPLFVVASTVVWGGETGNPPATVYRPIDPGSINNDLLDDPKFLNFLNSGKRSSNSDVRSTRTNRKARVATTPMDCLSTIPRSDEDHHSDEARISEAISHLQLAATHLEQSDNPKHRELAAGLREARATLIKERIEFHRRQAESYESLLTKSGASRPQPQRHLDAMPRPVVTTGATLPAPYYVEDDVKYFPAGPEYILESAPVDTSNKPAPSSKTDSAAGTDQQ